ncbi:MAG TPA: plastocyanin/azurin family copper-binding protein [Ktedonobacterales bacterium]|nr:plastocyanin/azurin family copper-binding protein [Ktedonobacterales bacterium]
MAPKTRAWIGGAVLAAALLALPGCGGPAANEVDTRLVSFARSSVTITHGEAVRFVSSNQSGGVHVLCIGHGLTCMPQPSAPAELNTTTGLDIEPGSEHDIIFPNAGTYHVICTIHPNMEMDVIVK